MRLIVRGITGSLHEFTCDPETTLKDIKDHLVELEGVPEAQILLVHAGQPLADTAIPADDLANFNRAGEIMLDLQVKMRDPVRIFLTSPLSRNKPICEAVEFTAPVTDVLDLLEDHGLTASIERTCAVIPKRDDGSTIPVPLVTSYTIADVYSCVQTALKSAVRHLTFIPALDGCLHVIASPSSEAPGNTHSVYSRTVMPQPIMWKHEHGQSVKQLSKALCL
eukprot:jgi/Ulvmu1/9404/UM051_0032.1